MSDIEKAQRLFQDSALGFPAIPEKLAEKLKQRDKWVFSTRPVHMSPYNLDAYIQEAEGHSIKDYALLSQAGHGINSYAIEYYLVHGSLHMFLHLGWGGVYMDAEQASATVRGCFSAADQVVSAAQNLPTPDTGKRLTIVGSDFYGSYWSPPGESCRDKIRDNDGPLRVLTQALHWLRNDPVTQR